MTGYGPLLRNHVPLLCRSINRILLQAYVPRLQTVRLYALSTVGNGSSGFLFGGLRQDRRGACQRRAFPPLSVDGLGPSRLSGVGTAWRCFERALRALKLRANLAALLQVTRRLAKAELGAEPAPLPTPQTNAVPARQCLVCGRTIEAIEI
jgi:hypothetical protein